MSDTQTEDQDVREHQEEIAGLLPALAQLDRTATELQEKTAAGQEVTAADISAYQQQAAHARHLVDAAGVDHHEVAEAEKEHRGDGDKGFAERAMDHATHPRSFEPTPPPADNGQDRDRDDDEEIDL
ncbi:hypothetical protein [Streptomyces sennicomposti]|uniref:hypothetical protein n=1 Tax=Streptomyces sennicomposti TaxID=2873384 RepID=UPI001CA74CF2|nr:hypothetical protein [Streptomyces sennicomposti]MBY8868729.1 hypothetical protein [Streptomyces sennicomposti]